MMKSILAFAVAAVSALALWAEDRVVESSGMGGSYRTAVNEALISALEKTEGVTLSSTVKSEINSSETSVTSSSGDNDRTAVNDSITKNMQKWASGKISGYDVVSEEYDQATGKYTVRLAVRLPGPYVVGLDPANRRRMAVVPFRPATGDSISWYGQAESSAVWAALLADKLNERLTQTRKFTMVDRKFDAEVNAELARLSAPNASKADAVRMNQKLGTDYLVVGDVSFFPVVAPGVNPLTNQALPMRSQNFAEISYSVLLAPTGQLKCKGTVVLDALNYPAADIRSFMSATAEGAATAIAGAMMSNILPPEIVGTSPTGRIIVGEGGKSISEGERFTVYALGDVMTDSRTGEEIDQLEEPVGTVEIERVTEKLSYAKFVEGDAKLMVKGCRLRRPKMIVNPQVPLPAPVTTTVGGNGTGGVVTPF